MKYIVVLSTLATLAGCAYLPIQDQHTVKKGETLERISKRYQISPEKLTQLNKWADISSHLPKDSIIYLSAPRGQYKSGHSYQNLKKASVKQPISRFIWPVHGKMTSAFGNRWGTPHHGIDISAKRGTPIKASAPGRVIYSGRERGYGNLVVVYHGAGYSTIYAHASKLLIRKGNKVKRGQIIALVGSTGRSTGPHLHYEIRKRKEPLNPILFLPRI